MARVRRHARLVARSSAMVAAATNAAVVVRGVVVVMEGLLYDDGPLWLRRRGGHQDLLWAAAALARSLPDPGGGHHSPILGIEEAFHPSLVVGPWALSSSLDIVNRCWRSIAPDLYAVDLFVRVITHCRCFTEIYDQLMSQGRVKCSAPKWQCAALVGTEMKRKALISQFQMKKSETRKTADNWAPKGGVGMV